MMNADNYKHAEITETIIKAFYKVYNILGCGFLEKVYENALFLELETLRLKVEKQKPIIVYYEEEIVGEYFADLVVENSVIVELKASKTLHKENEFQLINYLKATNIEVGLLLNFGERPELKRKVFSTKNHFLS